MTEPSKNETCVILGDWRVLIFPGNPIWSAHSLARGDLVLSNEHSVQIAYFPAGSWHGVLRQSPEMLRKLAKPQQTELPAEILGMVEESRKHPERRQPRPKRHS